MYQERDLAIVNIYSTYRGIPLPQWALEIIYDQKTIGDVFDLEPHRSYIARAALLPASRAPQSD